MRLMLAIRTKDSAGFTLVELLIATILSSLIVTVFISALLTMVSTAALQKTQLELSGQSQIALDTIERDIKLALDFGTTLPAPFQDPYGPQQTDDTWAGSWTYKGVDTAPASPQKVLLLRQMATLGHPLSPTRSPVYVQSSLANPYEQRPEFNCSVFHPTNNPTGSLTQNYKLPYYLIYFVRDNTLYRRTVVDTTTSLCNGPQYQKQSCPREDASRPASCQANDEIIAKDVAGFRVDYYQQEELPAVSFLDLDAYASSSPDVFAEAGSVVVTIRLQKTVAGHARDSELSVRVNRINL